jgi:hypothetical protein
VRPASIGGLFVLALIFCAAGFAQEIRRLPPIDLANPSASEWIQPATFISPQGSDSAPPSAPVSAAEACSPDCCPRCGCARCQCPGPPAPCIECPHVSTLLPNWNFNIFGAIQGNMLFNTARPVAPGVPFYLAPAGQFTENTVDVFAKSSSIGAVLSGPQVGQFRAGGMFMAFFYDNAVIEDLYGILPVQAWGDLRNEDWRFAAGLQFDVFCPNIPTMLVWSSLLASGNVGNNFPGQFRIERYLYPSDDSQWTLQFALTDPVPTGITDQDILTEDNGWPSLEGRVAYAVGEARQVGFEQKRALEIGFSTIGGQVRTTVPATLQVVANVFGMGVDYSWRINERWGVNGELYYGQALGPVNGGVLQTTNTSTFEAIRDSGGWFEAYYYITPCLHSHFGLAVDNPLNRDLATNQISLNETVFANLLWDATAQLRLGLELTWRKTNYIDLSNNEGVGVQTQVQWSF